MVTTPVLYSTHFIDSCRGIAVISVNAEYAHGIIPYLAGEVFFMLMNFS
jgi:hypothetical protein